MSREIRRVAADWEHPKRIRTYRPLRDGYAAELGSWDEGSAQWEAGNKRDWSQYPEVAWSPRGAEDDDGTFEEYAVPRPVERDYMPDWPEELRTHYQMYETTTEGTPVSPVLESPEAVARWCADNGASAMGSETASYEAWLRVAKGGCAPTMVSSGGETVSGVKAMYSDRFVS